MRIKLVKKFLIFSILATLFSAASFCYASPLSLISPCNVSDVPVDDYFKWASGPANTVKYILDINEFTQSEDNIPPSVCTGGVCNFAFLDLTVGNINYLASYTWRVVAYDISGTPVDSSPECTFTTEQEPSSDGNGNGNGNGDGGAPIGLLNPLKAESLEEAINAVINFLFYLVMALAPIMIIWAAALLLTARGDVKQVSKAKTIILWTLIALVIVLLAKGIPSLIKGVLSAG